MGKKLKTELSKTLTAHVSSFFKSSSPSPPPPPKKKKNGGTKCYAAASQSALPKGRDDPVPSISAYCRQRLPC